MKPYAQEYLYLSLALISLGLMTINGIQDYFATAPEAIIVHTLCVFIFGGATLFFVRALTELRKPKQ